MITNSGRLVLPDNGAMPSLDDLCLGLSRMHRFGGQYDRDLFWTVAHHLLLCEAMATADRWSAPAAFAALTHDVHEALTGDVTYHWKLDAVRNQQEKIDIRLGLSALQYDYLPQVKRLDDRALWAESFALHVKAFGPNLGRGTVSANLPRDVLQVDRLLGYDMEHIVAGVLRDRFTQYMSGKFPFFDRIAWSR